MECTCVLPFRSSNDSNRYNDGSKTGSMIFLLKRKKSDDFLPATLMTSLDNSILFSFQEDIDDQNYDPTEYAQLVSTNKGLLEETDNVCCKLFVAIGCVYSTQMELLCLNFNPCCMHYKFRMDTHPYCELSPGAFQPRGSWLKMVQTFTL